MNAITRLRYALDTRAYTGANGMTGSEVPFQISRDDLRFALDRIAELEAALRGATKRYTQGDRYGDDYCIHCLSYTHKFEKHTHDCPWVKAREVLGDE